MRKFIENLCIVLLFDSTILSLSFAESNDECKEIEEKSPHMRLERYLFCEYEPWISSLVDERYDVDFAMVPTIANFDEDNGNLGLFGWMIFVWEDSHLAWNASSFEGVEGIHIPAYKIWVPEIAVLSAGNEDDNARDIPSDVFCRLDNDGEVSCVFRARHVIRCQTDFTQWPFDRQNCTLVISTWLRSSEQMSFTDNPTETLEMGVFESDGEWTLTATRVLYDERKSIFSNKEGVTSPRLSIDFILDRVHSQLSGRYISPAIIMMVMTLVTLWLDPKSIERFAVACVNPVIHLHCIQDLHWSLPHNGSTVPNLLLFYAYSLVLAIMALLLTLFLEYLQESKVEPPKWISSSTAAILRSKVGHILLLIMLDPKPVAEVINADDSGNLVSCNPKTTAWGYVAIMCSWISFIVFFLTYVIMYAVLIPNASMRPPIDEIEHTFMLDD